MDPQGERAGTRGGVKGEHKRCLKVKLKCFLLSNHIHSNTQESLCFIRTCLSLQKQDELGVFSEHLFLSFKDAGSMIFCQWSTSHVELTGAARPTYYILTSKLATLPFVQTNDLSEIKKKHNLIYVGLMRTQLW